MAKPIRVITPITGPTFPAWTKKSDYYIPTSNLTIEDYETVNTLAGNDTIRPAGSLLFTNFGSLILGTGNDNVNYADNLNDNGSRYDTSGTIYNYALIDMGSGDDTLRAFSISNFGFSNFGPGVIRLGDGNDYMNSVDFSNEANVEGGAGNDIFEFDYYQNIGDEDPFDQLTQGGFINLGSGSDRFSSTSKTKISRNYGTIIAGLDSERDIDQITGYIIENQGIYRLGGGNDVCSFQGNEFSPGMSNLETGEIYMESGDDLLTDMNSGGIFNDGFIDMGTGNDTIKAYTISGSGRWLGGDGTDTISLGQDGTYAYDGNGNLYRPIIGAGAPQPVLIKSFEQIGGWNTSSNLDLLAGTYTISNNGGTIDFVA